MSAPSFAVAKRPSPGKNGMPIEVMTNLFPIRGLPRNVFSHYKVDFLLGQDEMKELSRDRKMDIILHLQTYVAPQLFTPKAAFDGQANMFSFKDLRFSERRFIVDMGEGKLPAGVTPRKQFTVIITKVAEISSRKMQDLLKGEIPGSTNSATILQVLNIFLQQAARARYPVGKKNSVFIDSNHHRINGLEIWHGHHQSVRPSFSGLLVNVDTTFTLMYARGELIAVLLDLLGYRSDVRRLSEIVEGSPVFIRVKRYLKGLTLVQKVNGRDKPRKVKSLHLNAGAFEFPLSDGRVITIADYFRTVKNTPLRYPSLPGIVTHRAEIIPFELLKIAPGQIYRGKATPDVVSKMMSVAKLSPEERLSKVKKSFVDLSLNSSPFVIETGMQVDMDPMLVRARILKAPTLAYGGGQLDPREGAWNIVGRSLYRPGELKAVLIVHYDPSLSRQQVEGFSSRLWDGMRRAGIAVQGMKTHGLLDGQKHWDGFVNDLASACRRADLPRQQSMIVAILPSVAGEIRKKLKQFGDISEGVPTQCIKKDGLLKASDQYINNVVLKINAKLGGINFVTLNDHLSWLRQKTVMILGVDVSHAGPGMMRPSIAGVVSSTDEFGARYMPCLTVQEPRVEKVVQLKNMMRWHMMRLRESRNCFIEHILVYRDGLSEGELDDVVGAEIQDIKDAARELDAPVPKITFVVVGKRHHVRFMPKHPSEGDRRSGNCPAGLIVDREIVSPAVFDFYLQSHSGLLGTSKSSHYICMADENNLGSDKLHEMSYALCHTYARATRAVSIPAPVYYADLVCARGDFHFNPKSDLNMDESASDGSTFSLDKWDEQFVKRVHENHLKNSYMYYM